MEDGNVDKTEVDFETGTFVGRVWSPEVGGPLLVTLRGGRLLSLIHI